MEGYLARLRETRENVIQALILYHLTDGLDGWDLFHLLISLIGVQSLCFMAVHLYCENMGVHAGLSKDSVSERNTLKIFVHEGNLQNISVCEYTHMHIFLYIYIHICIIESLCSVRSKCFQCSQTTLLLQYVQVKLEINLKSSIFLCGVPLKGNDGKNLTWKPYLLVCIFTVVYSSGWYLSSKASITWKYIYMFLNKWYIELMTTVFLLLSILQILYLQCRFLMYSLCLFHWQQRFAFSS